jgi:hypothetical protein
MSHLRKHPQFALIQDNTKKNAALKAAKRNAVPARFAPGIKNIPRFYLQQLFLLAKLLKKQRLCESMGGRFRVKDYSSSESNKTRFAAAAVGTSVPRNLGSAFAVHEGWTAEVVALEAPL